jgi:FkbM family methyltransferase
MMYQVPNSKIYFDLRNSYATDRIVVREIWEEDVYEVSPGRITDNGTVIDLGANIGAFSIYAAYHGGNVYAVEPEPNNLKALRTNISLNNMDDQITVVPFGITDKRGVAQISNDGGDSTIKDGVGVSEIETMSLNDLFIENDIEEVDVLKIDTEGSELETILGASRETLNKCRYITLEFDIRSGAQMGDMVRKLSETHHVRTMGSWVRGGMIWAWLY